MKTWISGVWLQQSPMEPSRYSSSVKRNYIMNIHAKRLRH
jgi:hypothetical protein